MTVEQKLDRLHKTIMAAAKPPCEMLVNRRLNKAKIADCLAKLDQARDMATEIYVAQN